MANITNNRTYTLLTIVFIIGLITSNIIAVKPIIFLNFIFPAGIIIFPVTYIIGDIFAEIYGFNKTKELILLGFFANLFVTIFIIISVYLPSANFWTDQNSYENILGNTPRILIASFIAYLIGSISNARSFTYVKKLTHSKYLLVRMILSTIIGEGLDSFLFITIAFIGIFDSKTMFIMIISQWMFKTSYETIISPLTYLVINKIKKSKIYI